MITIREATLKDIGQIRKVALVTFPNTYKEIISQEQIEFMLDWMYSEKNLEKQMMEDHHTYFLAEEDGEPLGYVSIQPLQEDLWELQKIYVLPDMHGRGLGRSLFETAEQEILKRNGRPCEMHLRVNRSNKALGFYKKMGMNILKEDDAEIGHGFLMTDYIMGVCLR